MINGKKWSFAWESKVDKAIPEVRGASTKFIAYTAERKQSS